MTDLFSLPQEKREKVIKRHSESIDKKGPNECWEWLGRKFDGYGKLSIHRKGNTKYVYMAHKISWIMHYKSSIPANLIVCHSCDNRGCVNPFHLFLATQKINLQDMTNKDRKFKTKLPKRLEIIDAIVNGMSIREAIKKYNVSNGSIYYMYKTKEVIAKYGIINLRHRSPVWANML